MYHHPTIDRHSFAGIVSTRLPIQIPLSNSFYPFLHDPYLIHHHRLYSTLATISNHHQHICPLRMCFLSSGLLLFHKQHPSHSNSMHFFPPFIKGCYITYSILSRAYISSQDLSPHSADMYTTTIHFVLSREYTLSTLHSY